MAPAGCAGTAAIDDDARGALTLALVNVHRRLPLPKPARALERARDAAGQVSSRACVACPAGKPEHKRGG